MGFLPGLRARRGHGSATHAARIRRPRIPAAHWSSRPLSGARSTPSTGQNSVTGLALAALQWGPACVLAVFGTAIEIAQFAVAMRTAQAIDFLIPAVVFIPHSARFQSRLCQAMRSARGKLAVDLSVSFATTTACVLAVGILTPLLFVNWYGPAYSGLSLLFALLFFTQWVTGASRPALRQLAADWDLHRIRRIMFVSMTGALALSLAGVSDSGRLRPLSAAWPEHCS